MKVWVRGGIDIVSTNAQKIEHEYHIMIQLVVPSLWVTMTWHGAPIAQHGCIGQCHCYEAC
jgi:hypothetical protein